MSLIYNVKMKFSTLIPLFLCLFFIHNTCKKETISVCGVTDPQENILWLKYNLLNILKADIYKLNFIGTDFVIITDKDLVYDGIAVVYDCQGQKLCEDGGYNPGSNVCNLTDAKAFWDAYSIKKVLLFKVRN